MAGCFPFPLNYNCENTYTDCSFGAGGGGGDVSPACKADPTEHASTVTEECAVFASASAKPGGDGTKAKPYASLAEAVANANGKRVLACASEAFPESVTIEAGVEVIGGFDCAADWTWSAEARSAIDAPADRIALTLTEGASGAKVRSFAVRAASAMEPGGSSIGVAVADVEAELAQVDVTAGDGMDGAKGETPAEAPQAGASAATMSASNACELPADVRGGEAGVTTCEDGETHGGRGGPGGTPGMDEGNGQRGEDGAPLPEAELLDEYGLGGMGQTDPDGACKPGMIGKNGARGTAGTVGSDTTLTLTGIAGGDGGTGTLGTRGQGGGGGGGAKAGLFCKPGEDIVEGPGASGGGGGAGGCGGKGGGGGKAGGSSVGILSLGTKLVLTDVTVAVGKAGKGGDGVAGQSGADGGVGATGGLALALRARKPVATAGRAGRVATAAPAPAVEAATPSASPMRRHRAKPRQCSSPPARPATAAAPRPAVRPRAPGRRAVLGSAGISRLSRRVRAQRHEDHGGHPRPAAGGSGRWGAPGKGGRPGRLAKVFVLEEHQAFDARRAAGGLDGAHEVQRSVPEELTDPAAGRRRDHVHAVGRGDRQAAHFGDAVGAGIVEGEAVEVAGGRGGFEGGDREPVEMAGIEKGAGGVGGQGRRIAHVARHGGGAFGGGQALEVLTALFGRIGGDASPVFVFVEGGEVEVPLAGLMAIAWARVWLPEPGPRLRRASCPPTFSKASTA